MLIFTQYSVGMVIYLDLDITGTFAFNSLTFDLPFMCYFLYVMGFFACFIPYTTECLVCWIQLHLMHFALPSLQYLNFDSNCGLFMSKPLIEVGPGFSFQIIAVFFPIVSYASNFRWGGGMLRAGIVWCGESVEKILKLVMTSVGRD